MSNTQYFNFGVQVNRIYAIGVDIVESCFNFGVRVNRIYAIGVDIVESCTKTIVVFNAHQSRAMRGTIAPSPGQTYARQHQCPPASV